jgi:hypothetical protein
MAFTAYGCRVWAGGLVRGQIGAVGGCGVRVSSGVMGPDMWVLGLEVALIPAHVYGPTLSVPVGWSSSIGGRKRSVRPDRTPLSLSRSQQMSRMACPSLSWIGLPIVVTFFCGGAYLLAAQRPSPRGQVFDKLIALVNSAPLVPAAGDDELRKLQVDRYNAALEMIKWRYKKYRNNLRDIHELYDQFALLIEARLDLCRTPAERIVAIEQFLENAKEGERNIAIAARVDEWSNADLERARYVRLGFEIALLKARREAGLAPRQ